MENYRVRGSGVKVHGGPEDPGRRDLGQEVLGRGPIPTGLFQWYMVCGFFPQPGPHPLCPSKKPSECRRWGRKGFVVRGGPTPGWIFRPQLDCFGIATEKRDHPEEDIVLNAYKYIFAHNVTLGAEEKLTHTPPNLVPPHTPRTPFPPYSCHDRHRAVPKGGTVGDPFNQTVKTSLPKLPTRDFKKCDKKILGPYVSYILSSLGHSVTRFVI